MRTPDSDDIEGGDAGGVDAGSLADGYGSTDLDEPATDTGTTDTTDSSPIGFADGGDGDGDDQDDQDDQYGSGSSDDELGAVDSSTTELSGDAAADDGNLYDVDPGDVASDTDLDFTGDGLVDNADFHEAVAGFFDFGVDETPADDPPADDVPDDVPDHAGHDLFGLFDG